MKEPTGLDPNYMQMAIDDTRQHLPLLEGGPFGACIVRDGEVLAIAHNTVLKEHDPTCHAEINAIRLASAQLGDHDLAGSTIYSTTEPCPMCFSAIRWANIARVVYGTHIADVARLGFNELSISNETMKKTGGSPVEINKDFMRDDCLALLEQWQQTPGVQCY